MISDEQVNSYRTDGYLVVENLFSDEQIEEVRSVIDEFTERGKTLLESDGIIELEESHTLAEPRLRRIIWPDKHHPVFNAFVRGAEYVGVVSRLIGPNIRLHYCKCNLKLGGFGAPVQWHQDWCFYPHTNDDVLVSGVLIDDMVDENGPLMVLPGTHKGPVFDHHHDGHFTGALDAEGCGLDFSKAVKLTAPAGSLVLFHVRLVHGSEMNRSSLPRRVVYYELAAADAWPLAGTYSTSLIPDLETYNARMVAGVPTIEPRLEQVPVRIPLPPPSGKLGIYNVQKEAASKYFQSVVDEAADRADVHHVAAVVLTQMGKAMFDR